MKFLLLLVMWIASFGPMESTPNTDVQPESFVINCELAKTKDQVEALGESLKSDLDALKRGQQALKAEVNSLRTELSLCCANSTVKDCDLNELWVSKVLGFSSEYGGSWAASKVIGPPDVYPRYGDIAGSWTPRPRTADDYIELEFESELYIKEVLIYETYHAGAVKTVEFRNPERNWDVQARYTPTDITQSRILTVDTQNSTYRTSEIKLTLDSTVAPTWVEIDAVKIKGTKDACA